LVPTGIHKQPFVSAGVHAHPARKLGRAPKRHDARTICLAKLLEPQLPPPPPVVDDRAKISNLGIMLNDTIGDCTCASAGHIIQALTAENGKQVILPDSDILAAYEAITGYNPSDPSTDTGAVELDVLNYWRKTGIGGHVIGAYASIAPTNLTELKQAISIFGNVYAGVDMPLCIQDADTWEAPKWWQHGGNTTAGSWGGHAVPIVAYDTKWFYIISWGEYIPVSPAFIDLYFTEAYAVMSPDEVNDAGVTPDGFNTAQLQQYLAMVA